MFWASPSIHWQIFKYIWVDISIFKENYFSLSSKIICLPKIFIKCFPNISIFVFLSVTLQKYINYEYLYRLCIHMLVVYFNFGSVVIDRVQVTIFYFNMSLCAFVEHILWFCVTFLPFIVKTVMYVLGS